MLRPNRLVTILLILAVLLPVTNNPFFNVSAAPLAVAPTLGSAASFGVLGGSTVTNTGPTVVNGNLGLSPGSAVTGFPPGVIVSPGIMHAGDALALQAQNDVTIAYNALTSQSCNVNLTSQDLGGLTLTPGIYCFDTSAQLTGALTLDVQGDPNAVFIFQMGSTLTTAPGSSVVFINGGPSCNVFWQVGSSATFNTTTVFAGNVIVSTSITVNTDASVIGRVFARNGAVTLDSNTITRCVAAAAATPTSTPTSTPTNTPGPSPTPTSTPTNTPTNTPGPSPTSTNTPTSTPTNTPGPSPTPTSTPTATNTPPATAVELLYFVAGRHGETVVLQWATAQEIDNYGFNLYRAPIDDFTRAELIHFEPSAIRGGTGSGTTYSYLDTPPVDGRWWYWLADIDTHGIQTLYNPSIAIARQTNFQVYLPWTVGQ